MDEDVRQLTDAFGDLDSTKIITLIDEKPSLAGLSNRLEQNVIWLASRYGMLDVVKFLLQPKFMPYVDMFKFDVARRDAYDIAETYGHQQVIEHMKAHYMSKLDTNNGPIADIGEPE